MKTQFKIGAFALSLFLASCGGGEEATTAAADTNKPPYDCECNTLKSEKGGRFNQNSLKKMMSGDKPYSGTCAILSNNRSKDIIFLAEYKDGYPAKKQRWTVFNNERILVEDYTFDDQNKKTGFFISLGNEEWMDSSSNKKYAIIYPWSYSEWKDNREIYSYSFMKLPDPAASYEENNYYHERQGFRFNSQDKELINLTESCFPKEKILNPFWTDPKDTLVERAIVVKTFNFNDPKIKQYFDCLESNKSKIKKWFVKQMEIDEESAVAE